MGRREEWNKKRKKCIFIRNYGESYIPVVSTYNLLQVKEWKILVFDDFRQTERGHQSFYKILCRANVEFRYIIANQLTLPLTSIFPF